MTRGDLPRYPGSPPFDDSDLDRALFVGRKHESDVVLHSILTNDLFVLFGISGTGKTSLLRAGVMHTLREHDLWPFRIRLNDPTTSPLALIRAALTQHREEYSIEVLGIDADPRDLWDLLSGLEIWRGDVLQMPVLIFDQFEELFTLWPEETRGRFVTEFGDVVRGTRASRPSNLTSPDRTPPPNVKIVLSIREDFLGDLDAFSQDVPQILSQRYRLLPLNRRQADAAIRIPATVEDDRLTSPPFVYSDSIVNEILDFLSAEEQRDETVIRDAVEAFQLQIICQHIEEKILPNKIARTDHVTDDAPPSPEAEASAPLTVTSSDVDGVQGLRDILREFYRRQLHAFADDRQRRIRALCETGLISPRQRRRSLERDEIFDRYLVTDDELEQLVKQRLLRGEVRVGSVYYELAHDSLVGPILAHMQRASAEENAERRARRRDVALFGAAMVVVVMALTGVVITISADILQKELEFAAPLIAGIVGILATFNYMTKPRTRAGRWRSAAAVLGSVAALLLALGNGELIGEEAQVRGLTAPEVTLTAYDAETSTATTPEGVAQADVPLFIEASNAEAGQLIVDVQEPANGAVTLTFDPDTTTHTASYVPQLTFSGRDSFSYTACLQEEDICDTGEVTVLVNPYAIDVEVQTVPGEPVEVNVLANDVNAGLAVSVIEGPSEGVARVMSAGTIEYTPTRSFDVTDSFRYRVCAEDLCATAKVTVVEVDSLLTVPDVVATIDAGAVLRALGFQVTETIVCAPDLPAGQVVTQEPEAATRQQPGSQVDLTIASGSQFTTITPDAIGPIWLLDVLNGDREFNSQGPHVYAEIRSDWETGDVVKLQIYMQAIETAEDWTQASGTSDWLEVFTPPQGHRVIEVIADGASVPARGRGSTAGEFGTIAGRGGVSDPMVIDEEEDIADSHQYRDTGHTPDEFTGSKLVKSWRFVGDTLGTDVGNDEGDDDSNVTVELRPLTIRYLDTSCIPQP